MEERKKLQVRWATKKCYTYLSQPETKNKKKNLKVGLDKDDKEKIPQNSCSIRAKIIIATTFSE